MLWRSKFGRVLILALAVGLGVPLTANAAFTLTLSSGGQTLSPPWEDDDGDGVITVSANINGFSFQGDIATSNAPNTDGGPAVLTLSQLSIRKMWDSVDIRTLTITIVETGFESPVGQVDVTTRLTALELMRDDGSITSRSFLNNEQVGDAVELTETGSDSRRGSTTIGTSPYSLKSETSVTLGRGGMMLSFGSTEVSPVPAPATAVMALAGVPVLGAFGWFRRRGRPTPPPAA